MKRSRNRLIYGVSILLVIGFLATSLASYVVSLYSIRKEISQNALPLTSDTVYSEIQRDLLRPVLISSVMANDTFLKDWVINGEKDKAEISKYLNQIKTKYHAFTSFFVSDKSLLYYHADGVLKKISTIEERDEWYFRVRQMPAAYEINVDPDMANKDEIAIFINYKVYDYNGQFIGAAGLGLAITKVKELVDTYQKRYNRRIFFIDQAGASVFYGSRIEDRFNINDIDGLSTHAKNILSNEYNSFKYQKNGKTFYLNTRYIKELKVFLLVEQAEEAAVALILNALLLNLLICSIITVVVFFLMRFVINAYQHKLERMATTDKLTGLLNRHAFEIIIDQSFKDYKRKKEPISILMLDIDYFKKVNDKYGHLVGDKVIQNIAKQTESQIRSSDALCRWGGEEFLVLLKNCDIDNAYVMAEKIRKTIKESAVDSSAEEVSVTVSIGIAQFKVSERLDELLLRADEALYRAKDRGRDMSELEAR